MEIIINNQVHKQYRNTIYYASENGDIYSEYSKKYIKGISRKINNKEYAYIDVFNDKTHKQQHTNVHKIVWTAWNGEIPDGYQINHKNDNGLDNRLDNLYIGNQKENIQDCIKNGHRVGNVFYLTVYDKEKNKILTFCPAKNFIKYSGHSNKSGSLNKFFNKHWFKKRYEIIEFKRIDNLSEYQNVTTMGDECSPVE